MKTDKTPRLCPKLSMGQNKASQTPCRILYLQQYNDRQVLAPTFKPRHDWLRPTLLLPKSHIPHARAQLQSQASKHPKQYFLRFWSSVIRPRLCTEIRILFVNGLGSSAKLLSCSESKPHHSPT
ncbi:hypothetical protein FOXG_18782 [Fusarium oxysporum f. sp. lycopersici 4287]|uniref:Uncharacterized protein n=2 Tax=Fusarium oxysporum TaxID=5507 RepID=A0A0J9UNQ0_FUSO4|nr:hypothetical protein FOXG_18782 [Fusarium oxysporum f. sp. lycopersici 4287]XP_018238930.1 hypothetical protein FOXG_18782 [Fusarium oxysporum f. sp. lycopersici 4287]EXK44043.1 hypothetical protein FOMG_02895 [Fusarium oxysporum f. sp. melonis 26406]EXK44044.1 hypothetical protein FOMG_02895 [Fusarium oxysporum f. sp. melonis 26406]KNB00884.1 hypothetical protein FOXG_18782 [Fusarium oxysporum f. sp. lycopersici 4287]KNB00885.1 hypothetical protein FOXG_18782 [Fusarium oxysporum f. sp. lyc